MNIKTDADCDNAPKKQLVLDYNTAFINKQKDTLLDFLHQDCTQNIVGEDLLSDKNSIEKVLDRILNFDPKEMVIENLLSHGKLAACNGTITLASNAKIYFSEFYVFSSHSKDAKIISITSYGIGEK